MSLWRDASVDGLPRGGENIGGILRSYSSSIFLSPLAGVEGRQCYEQVFLEWVLVAWFCPDSIKASLKSFKGDAAGASPLVNSSNPSLSSQKRHQINHCQENKDQAHPRPVYRHDNLKIIQFYSVLPAAI